MAICDIAGELPTISCPYIGNSNNHPMMNKSFVNPSKLDGSSHVAGNHVISVKNNSHFLRVLQYVSCKECIFVFKNTILSIYNLSQVIYPDRKEA